MTTLKWLMAAGTFGLFSGAATADSWRHDARWDQRREEARMDYQRRLARCGDSEHCRRHARHHYERQLSHIERHRF